MNIVQTLRRLGQQMNGWSKSINAQTAQMQLIKKLYAKNGLELKMTCPACPEQYDVFKDGKQVGYFRLRHGEFRVDYQKCGGETIYEAEPSGDGIFEDSERLLYLNNAMKAILLRLNRLT
jgi:mRNA-degrading endonuclease RelE of RelBE toxin-antitoxin system